MVQNCGPRESVCNVDEHADPLAWIDDELAGLERAGLRRRLAERASAQTATITLDGRELVNFGSNDYLGLAADPRLGGRGQGSRSIGKGGAAGRVRW